MYKYCIIIALVMLSACASIFDGTKQNIHVAAIDTANNKPIPDVKCIMLDDMGTAYNIESNPANIKVKKGQGPLRFDCKKDGYVQKHTVIKEKFASVTFFNVLLFPIGFIVDGATGAMLEYPDNIAVQMEELIN